MTNNNRLAKISKNLSQVESNSLEVIKLVKNNVQIDLKDFGQEPILYARLFKGSELGILGLISSFLLASAFSPLTGAISLIILANDWRYKYLSGKQAITTPVEVEAMEAVEVVAKEVEVIAKKEEVKETVKETVKEAVKEEEEEEEKEEKEEKEEEEEEEEEVTNPATTKISPLYQSKPVANVSIPKAPTAYSVLIANPFSSRAGFGWQRTGKTYLFAIATQELALERGVQIFHINMASYGDEDAQYWGHAVKSIRCDLPSLDSYQAQYYTDEAIECVHQFFATRNAILVFDEIVLTGSLSNQHAEIVAPLLKLVADKISCLASTGVKRAQAIWTLSPDFVAGACTQDCKALKSLSLCYISIPPGKSVDWNGNPVKFHQETFENVKRNFPSLTYPEGKWKGDRICFVDGQWRELGELPALHSQTKSILSKPKKQNSMLSTVQKLEQIYKDSESSSPSKFENLIAKLNQPEEEKFKLFVLWLSKRQGEEITFEQVKGGWARNAGVERSKEALLNLIHFAIQKELLSESGNNKWVVEE